ASVISKGISNPDQMIKAGDVNISGVDFWHAVEFSRNGRFLRSHFRGPSGLRSFVFQAYQMISAPIFRSSSFRLALAAPLGATPELYG
ncbi:hypothetical protein, partial [Kitasatospora sp. LaBMicrA B282]|uniref:hypothetical protein n=1 Tax=Kitasatospora sp. LaBMicrA B282 TaxID=3420949 RepID=UPI003D0A3AD9